MHGRGQKQIKIVIALVGIAVLLVVFWLAVRGIEEKAADRKSTGADNAGAAGGEAPEMFGEEIELCGETFVYDHDIETWLFIGTDNSGNEKAQGKEYRGTMADFLLLVVLDKTDKSYGFLQLDRDTVTEVEMVLPGVENRPSSDLQLCTAHWYGEDNQQSCENTVKAVSGLLGGISIDGYYSIGLEEIPTLNHAVGGVEVTVLGDFSKIDPSLKEGETILLSDEQAETYIHSRFHVGDETNTERMDRHSQYMGALFAKVNEKIKEEPDFLNDLYSQFEDEAVTDAKGRDISRIANQMAGAENKGILRMEGETKLGKRLGDGIDHAEFYPDEDSLKEVMTELYHLEKKDE